MGRQGNRKCSLRRFVNDFSLTLSHLADTPDAARKLAVSTQSLASGGTAGPGQGGAQPLTQRKRLLRAPTLAELDSSDSDVRGRESSP